MLTHQDDEEERDVGHLLQRGARDEEPRADEHRGEGDGLEEEHQHTLRWVGCAVQWAKWCVALHCARDCVCGVCGVCVRWNNAGKQNKSSRDVTTYTLIAS